MSILQEIKKRLNGEHKCPAYWWEAGMEDCDEGCYIHVESFECWKCKWRFFPDFIIRLRIKWESVCEAKRIKEEQYFTLLEELSRLQIECAENNWDGYDALPVEKQTIENAFTFISKLPIDHMLPEIGVEPDGMITFDWYKTNWFKRYTFSVSIDKDNCLYYVTLVSHILLTGISTSNGKCRLESSLPEEISKILLNFRK